MIVVTCAAGAGASPGGICAKLEEATRTATPTAPANAMARCNMKAAPKTNLACEIQRVGRAVNLILARRPQRGDGRGNRSDRRVRWDRRGANAGRDWLQNLDAHRRSGARNRD